MLACAEALRPLAAARATLHVNDGLHVAHAAGADGDPIGPAADLYSLGCVLFELLTGSPPYRAETAIEMLHRHLKDPVPLVADLRADVPEDLTHLVYCLMAKVPEERPGSADEVRRMLEPFAQ